MTDSLPKMIREGWKWAIQRLAIKVFWDWEFIPLFGMEPYVFGITIWSWPRKVKNEEEA